ncbi:MAG TPA: Dam family site-specific DNA-(adenine-N6)-methyltransferase [Pyrinomonadaceae bacterium]|nr:Dam family site-specific DNA-(adenine-N6)-methyltransferase [Pyrinomonadaceae bacterium]
MKSISTVEPIDLRPPADEGRRESRGVQSRSAERLLTPPLKWAGGKRWLVPKVASIWEQNRQKRYVEPFCGGLAMALGLRPERALLNDINPHLINFYSHIQNGLKLTIEMANDEQLFYSHRDRFNRMIEQSQDQTSTAAELFYFLNRTCFNGLCRFNQSGEFNVPFGTYKNINYVSDFHQYQRLFAGWKFTNLDLSALLIEKDDFIYADPPYDVEFTTYSSGGFSWEDQKRTAELLAAHLGPVVLSNQATPRIVDLYEKLGFTLSFLDAPRRISCTGDRTAAKEVLAVKGV